MFKKFTAIAINYAATLAVFVAAMGVGINSWFFNYQPAPPKELK